jgi:hypothetical protein
MSRRGGVAQRHIDGARQQAPARGPAIELEPLITDVAPLADWQRVFTATRRAEGIRFLFDPRLGSDIVRRVGG